VTAADEWDVCPGCNGAGDEPVGPDGLGEYGDPCLQCNGTGIVPADDAG
jgi:DnaJ-class molecular chaperone